MGKEKERVYSRYAVEALMLLGKQIRMRRKQCRWTESELAERAHISRATLQKIEQGHSGCQIGLVFEVAVLLGIPLFVEADAIERFSHMTDTTLALLPQRIYKDNEVVEDDF